MKIIRNKQLLENPEPWNYLTVLKEYEDGTKYEILMTPEEYRLEEFKNELKEKYKIDKNDMNKLESLCLDYHDRENEENE